MFQLLRSLEVLPVKTLGSNNRRGTGYSSNLQPVSVIINESRDARLNLVCCVQGQASGGGGLRP